MKKLIAAVFIALLFTHLAPLSHAQVARAKVRWRLEFKLLGKEKPDIYTHTDPLGKAENYWYVWFELSNRGEVNMGENAPTTYLDIMMHTEHGMLLESDVRKIDPKYAVHRGNFYLCIVPDPSVERQIIKQLSDSGDLNEGVFEEKLDQWKKEGKYLNISEIHRLGVMKPGQTITGVAIFDNIDPYSRKFDFRISGYKDVIKVEGFENNSRQQTLEMESMTFNYKFPGDWTQRQLDVVEILSPLPDVQVRTVGPVSSKDTLEFLITMMVEGVKQERKASDEKKGDEKELPEGPSKRDPGLITPQDMRVAATFLNWAVDGMQKESRFQYNHRKSILDNEDMVIRWHEWWIRNASRLQYDDTKSRYILSDEKAPGVPEEE